MSQVRAAYTVDDGQVIPTSPAVLLDSHEAKRCTCYECIMQDEAAVAIGLKPCPFCGGTVQLERSSDTGECYVYCDPCEFAARWWFTEAEAIAAWNTRNGEG